MKEIQTQAWCMGQRGYRWCRRGTELQRHGGGRTLLKSGSLLDALAASAAGVGRRGKGRKEKGERTLGRGLRRPDGVD